MDIPQGDSVLRHIPYGKLMKDAKGNIKDESGTPYGILPQAFELRALDKNKLSVNWIEYFKKATFRENLVATVQDVRKNRSINKKSQCGFGIAKASKIKEVCKSLGFDKVKVVYAKSTANPSHANIIRLPNNDDELMTSLARDAFLELELNEDLP